MFHFSSTKKCEEKSWKASKRASQTILSEALIKSQIWAFLAPKPAFHLFWDKKNSSLSSQKRLPTMKEKYFHSFSRQCFKQFSVSAFPFWFSLSRIFFLCVGKSTNINPEIYFQHMCFYSICEIYTSLATYTCISIVYWDFLQQNISKALFQTEPTSNEGNDSLKIRISNQLGFFPSSVA